MNFISRRIRPVLILCLSAAPALHAGAANPPAASPSPPASSATAAPDAAAVSREEASYSLGLSFATQWREGGMDGILSESDLVRGIHAGLSGAPLTPEDRQRASSFLRAAYQAWASRNKQAAEQFLAQNAKQPGVKTTSSGLQYQVMTAGDPHEPTPNAADRVTVHYRGRLLNGTEFDSTYSRGKPGVIRPNDAIAGWREALGMMSKGAVWRLFVPPELAYAMTPPPSIPPNSLLIFDVEVLGVAQTADARAPTPMPSGR